MPCCVLLRRDGGCSLQLAPFKHRRLSVDMGRLLENTSDADVTFMVNGERILAHRVILSARSQYFNIMFSSGFKEGAKKAVIEVPDTTVEAFRALIRYLYTAELALDSTNAIQVMQLAHLYDIRELYDL